MDVTLSFGLIPITLGFGHPCCQPVVPEEYLMYQQETIVAHLLWLVSRGSIARYIFAAPFPSPMLYNGVPIKE